MKNLRRQIDRMDEDLVKLVNERARVASEIGCSKTKDGSKAYAPNRERAVYNRVTSLNEGPLPDTAFRAIYREIMSATIALESPTRICFFGQPGSFTHLAARTRFARASVTYEPARDMRDVFLAVSRGWADFGLIPIENSTEGGVNESIDLLAETRLKICGEIYLPIHQHLLARCEIKDIKLALSHPQAIAQ